METNQGYPNQLYTALHLGNPTLKLVKLGCPGETTATMINGGICTYSAGNQLAQAAAFLASHKGKVQLVTIDIGANDLNPCVVLPTINEIVAVPGGGLPAGPGQPHHDHEHADHGQRQRPAADHRHVLLRPRAGRLAQGRRRGQGACAKDSIALAQAFDNLLGGVYTGFGAKVADVFTAFHTTAFHATVTLPAFGEVPKDVGYLCMYTWECAAPPVGPNEHANVLGYGVIANTFLNTYLG